MLSRERRVSIYTGFVEAIERCVYETISPEHLAELTHKRGLHSTIIKQARLLSGTRKSVELACSTLLDKFSTVELDEAGITHQGNPSTRWMEDEENPNGKIIIPYLNTNQNAIYLRAHKRGPSGVDIEVYGQQILTTGPEEIVITEGEYKALALIQCNIPALAIPGISSFAGKHYDKLEQLLTQHKIKKAIILFDNEVKDDPSLPGFKDDPIKRWDTDYYAIRMANKLYMSIKSGLIARLPDEWRIDGKIDPDGALAAGKRPEELQKIIRAATIPRSYREQLSYEARVVVGYKLERDRLYASKLQEQRGVYTWKESQDEVLTLSNFLLHPKRQTRRADGTLERVYQAVSRQGEEAELVLTPSEFTQNQSFKRNLLNTGNFHWSGNQRQLEVLAERLFVSASPKVAEEAERFGRQEDGRWVFGDGILDGTNRFPLGDDGVVWGQSLKGIIPLQDDRCPVPKMLSHSGQAPDLCDVYQALQNCIGTSSVGLGLGWILGCVWADEIFAQLGFYPILGIFGEAGAGKTMLGRMFTSGWGLPAHSQNPLKLDGSTAKGMERTFAKYASMPVWADEYRNDLYARTIHTLRSIYDRSSGVMAEYSNDNRTKGSDIRGCLILSGEEFPTDPALLSRLILISLSLSDRNVSGFDQANKMMMELPKLVSFAIAKRDELKANVMECIHNFMARLRPKAGDERLAWLYAVPLGVFAALLSNEPGPNNKEGKALGELIGWTENELHRLLLMRKENDHLGRFWAALNVLACEYNQGHSLINRMHIGLSRDGKSALFWFRAVYKIYAKFERQITGAAPFAEATIKDYLQKSAYIKKGTTPRQLGGGVSRRCLTIDLTHESCPEEVREFATKISTEDWDLPRYGLETRVENDSDAREQDGFFQ